MHTSISTRKRLLIAIVIAILSGALCYLRLEIGQIGAADFTWSWRGAKFLLTGADPYKMIQPSGPYPYDNVLFYPIPALLIALPTTLFPLPIAGAVFFGLSSGLLCWGLLRNGFHSLLAFLSTPYLYALLTVQWSPLIAAAAFLPALGPVLLAKPNIGLPVLVAFANRRSLILCGGVLLISFFLFPAWPYSWWRSLPAHVNYIPLLSWWGVFLTLTLLHWRSQSARLLFAMSIVPQRLLYDQLNLWLLPKTLRESVMLTVASWIGLIVSLAFGQGTWILMWTYVPALVVVLAQQGWPSRTNIFGGMALGRDPRRN